VAFGIKCFAYGNVLHPRQAGEERTSQPSPH